MATYRHKTIRRFAIGKFEFKNHLLVTKSEEDDAEFKRLLSQAPMRQRQGIVVINESALAALESKIDVGPKTIRGAQSSHTIEAGVKGSPNPHKAGTEPSIEPNKNPADSGGKPGANLSGLAGFTGLTKS